MHNNLNYKNNIIGLARWNLRNTLNHFKISILFGMHIREFHFASWLLHCRDENNFSKMVSQMSGQLYG